MEFIDILNPDGTKTGQAVSKPEVHAKGLWHRTVHVWLLNSQKEILLQLRSSNKETYPNMWDVSAAGHISAGEDSLTAAIRETGEELGLRLAENDFESVGSVTENYIKNEHFEDNEIQDIYLVRRDVPASSFKIQASEVQEVKWVLLSRFREMVAANDPTLVMHKEFGMLLKYLKA